MSPARIGGRVGVTAVRVLASFAACGYGAQFAPPSPPSPPPAAAVHVIEPIADDDDPIRGTAQVVDDRAGWGRVHDHYRRAAPSADGWTPVVDVPGHLCLDRRDDDVHDVVEVRRYSGTRVPPATDRCLVVTARTEQDRGGCGQADPWVSTDLTDPDRSTPTDPRRD